MGSLEPLHGLLTYILNFLIFQTDVLVSLISIVSKLSIFGFYLAKKMCIKPYDGKKMDCFMEISDLIPAKP